tara:strand:- start:314 stop:502 length:189 start_codon:yes stop_codon:yes gene_type:complete
MKCWHCSTELIWGSDFSGEDYGCEEQYSIVTNLHCPKCESYVEVYYPNQRREENEKEIESTS